MPLELKDLEGYTIKAADGKVGKVEDFFFDDHEWAVRYVVVDTGTWLTGRTVLISPEAVGLPDKESKSISVDLMCEQIENSPPIGSDEPVSRQKEKELMEYYDWPKYWTPIIEPTTEMIAPVAPIPRHQQIKPTQTPDQPGDPNLRSLNEVCGYDIHAKDGELGDVADFLADPNTWLIRYMVIDTGGWLPGKQVLVAPEWILDINWADTEVSVALEREQMRTAPEYDPRKPLDPRYEGNLAAHYGLGEPKRPNVEY